jgi:hypothetical protein
MVILLLKSYSHYIAVLFPNFLDIVSQFLWRKREHNELEQNVHKLKLSHDNNLHLLFPRRDCSKPPTLLSYKNKVILCYT